MFKKSLIAILLLMLSAVSGMTQDKYNTVSADCDNTNTTFTIYLSGGNEIYYFTCKLIDGDAAAGSVTIVRYKAGGTAIETNGIYMEEGDSFTTRVRCDSIQVTKTAAADYFCYEIAR